MGEPSAEDPRSDARADMPMASRDPLHIEADVVAAHAAGLGVDELSAIYRLERGVVERIIENAEPDQPRPRRSRLLSVVSGRRRRRGSDTPHTAAG